MIQIIAYFFGKSKNRFYLSVERNRQRNRCKRSEKTVSKFSFKKQNSFKKSLFEK